MCLEQDTHCNTSLFTTNLCPTPLPPTSVYPSIIFRFSFEFLPLSDSRHLLPGTSLRRRFLPSLRRNLCKNLLELLSGTQQLAVSWDANRVLFYT